MQTASKRLVILISGSGSNLQAFIDQCANGKLKAHIAAVISNKAEAYGLVRAEKAGINTHVIKHGDYANRESFDAALADLVDSYQADAVILAGFMRILTPVFVDRFHGRLLNIHPSLLPKYPGLNTHQRAIDAKDSHSGASIHFVTAELDGGPVILQAEQSIEAHDTADTLAAKVLQKEHIIYPMATQWLLTRRLKLHEDGAYLDEKLLPKTGLLLDNTTGIARAG